MRTRQAQQLQADVLAQLDESGSPKPVATDLLEWLNQEWASVYAHLVDKGFHWNLQQTFFVTNPGQDVYGTADGAWASNGSFWKTQGIDIEVSGTQWMAAHRFQFERRNDYGTADWSWPRRVCYDIWGGTIDATGADNTVIKFTPIPGGIYTIRHFWFPAPQRMVNPTDVIDGVAGAELAMIYGACQRGALQTEQFELADRYAALKAQKWAEIITHLSDRNTGEAPMARVVRGRRAGRGRGRWWGC